MVQQKSCEKFTCQYSKWNNRFIIILILCYHFQMHLHDAHDAMIYVRAYGCPDFFITFTCNHIWDEVKEFYMTNNIIEASIFNRYCKEDVLLPRIPMISTFLYFSFKFTACKFNLFTSFNAYSFRCGSPMQWPLKQRSRIIYIKLGTKFEKPMLLAWIASYGKLMHL